MNKTYILVKGLNSHLNVVGMMESSKTKGVMDFKVITVMKKKDFIAKGGRTIVIKVRD